MKVIVADSSYIVAGLLQDSLLLDGQGVLLSPDIAFYEVIQALWKHQVLLKRISDASPHIESFMVLIDAGKIQLLRPDKEVMLHAYQLAVKKKTTFYDAVFVVLARKLGFDLKTFDKEQARLFEQSK